MSGSPAAQVRVVTVTYSPGDTLRHFLDTLAGATTRPHTVVMADNGSRDGAPQAEEAAGRAALLHTGGNVGYGTAANLGSAGDEPWVVVANPDITWRPGSLDVLLDATERWPRGGAFGPAIVTPQGQLYPSARDLPSLGRGVAHALLGWWWPANPWTRSYRRDRGQPRERTAGWLSGSCLLLRRSAFAEVGGFDPRYFMFFEDVDLCDRLGRAGWASVYVPSAVVEHVGGHSWRDQPQIMVKAHHASTYRYLRGRYPHRWQWPLRMALKAGIGARYLASRAVAGIGRGAAPVGSADQLSRAPGAAPPPPDRP